MVQKFGYIEKIISIFRFNFLLFQLNLLQLNGSLRLKQYYFFITPYTEFMIVNQLSLICIKSMLKCRMLLTNKQRATV